MISSIQGGDSLELLTRLDPTPIGLELGTMRGRPFVDQSERRPGPKAARQDLTVEGEGCLLTLVFRVKVRHAMFTIEHADEDAEEDRDDGHVGILPAGRAVAQR